MNINTNVYKQYINSRKAYGNYTQQVFSLNGTRKNEVKQDSFSLSAEAALIKESNKTVKNCASDIVKPASDERIQSLRERIINGEYNVSAQQVADSILNRWI